MVNTSSISALPRLLEDHEDDLLAQWVKRLRASGAATNGRIKDSELLAQCRAFLGVLRKAVASGNLNDAEGADYGSARELLGEISRQRASQGFSPRETATFVLSFKQPVFERLSQEYPSDAKTMARESWILTQLLDQLGLYTIEVHQKSREEMIVRQGEEIAELSTPVVKLWDGILALPLIGTLDSERTQVVMESLLQSIVDNGAEIAIIDITGVPTVDTQVAQHLLKTVAAARLMGADCMVSGIRPQIAQTMVHLGVELNVISKATLADAFALALQRTGRTVVPAKTTMSRS